VRDTLTHPARGMAPLQTPLQGREGIILVRDILTHLARGGPSPHPIPEYLCPEQRVLSQQFRWLDRLTMNEIPTPAASLGQNMACEGATSPKRKPMLGDRRLTCLGYGAVGPYVWDLG